MKVIFVVLTILVLWSLLIMFFRVFFKFFPKQEVTIVDVRVDVQLRSNLNYIKFYVDYLIDGDICCKVLSFVERESQSERIQVLRNKILGLSGKKIGFYCLPFLRPFGYFDENILNIPVYVYVVFFGVFVLVYMSALIGYMHELSL